VEKWIIRYLKSFRIVKRFFSWRARLDESSVATSREGMKSTWFFTGEKYSHIIDLETRVPPNRAINSVSVFFKKVQSFGDALATSVFIMGREHRFGRYRTIRRVQKFNSL